MNSVKNGNGTSPANYTPGWRKNSARGRYLTCATTKGMVPADDIASILLQVDPSYIATIRKEMGDQFTFAQSEETAALLLVNPKPKADPALGRIQKALAEMSDEDKKALIQLIEGAAA